MITILMQTLELDELWLFVILPMLAAAMVALVEWRRHRADVLVADRVTILESQMGQMQQIASSLIDQDDEQELAGATITRVVMLEGSVNTIGHRLDALERGHHVQRNADE